jgi:hypothetical protein
MKNVPAVTAVDSRAKGARGTQNKPAMVGLEKAYSASMNEAKESLKSGNVEAAAKAATRAASIGREMGIGKQPKAPRRTEGLEGVTVGTGKTKRGNPEAEEANVVLGVEKPANPAVTAVRGTGNVVLGVRRAVDASSPSGKALTDVKSFGNVMAGGANGKKSEGNAIIGGRKVNDPAAPKVGGAVMQKARKDAETQGQQKPFSMQSDAQRNLFNQIA